MAKKSATIRDYNTTISTNSDGATEVKFYDTIIVTVKFYPVGAHVTLRTGGFFTATTKVRMNETASDFGLKFSVYAEKKVWYVRYHNGTEWVVLPFDGNMAAFTTIDNPA
jgi:hypothetical protein